MALQLELDKTSMADPTGNGILDNVGELIVYNIVITNGSDAGEPGFETVRLTDELLGLVSADVEATAGIVLSEGGVADGVLSPGETWTLSGPALNYMTDQDDFDSNGTAEPGDLNVGFIDNDAEVRATTAGLTNLRAGGSTATEIVVVPGIDLLKTGAWIDGDGDGHAEAGERIEYTLEVSNTGNTALEAIAVSDPDADPGSIAPVDLDMDGVIDGDLDGDGKLDVSEIWVYTAAHTLTEADLDLDEFCNIATVEGMWRAGADDHSDTVTATDEHCEFLPQPAIDIEKATNGEDADAPFGPYIPVGDPVDWTYDVTNTGNVDLDDVLVVDDQGVTVSGPAGDDGDGLLNPGEIWTYTGSGIATDGQYANIGAVTATSGHGATVDDSDPSHYFGLISEIDIEKATNGVDADLPEDGPLIPVGDQVAWTYVVTNNGNQPLFDVDVVDDVLGPIGTIPELAAGESVTLVADGLAEFGPYANIGTATGMDVLDRTVTDSDPSHYLGGEVSVDIEKATNGADADTPEGPAILVGGAVLWEYAVFNDGQFDLTNVVVTDDRGEVPLFVGGDDGDGLLNPGETWLYEAAGTATPGQYANIGSVSAATATGLAASDSDPSHYFGVAPDITIEKTGVFNDENGDGYAQPGETISYAYAVTDGDSNVPITLDKLAGLLDDAGSPGDPGDDFNPVYLSGDDGDDGLLGDGETWLFEADYAVDAEDIAAGGVLNTVCATGTETRLQTEVEACDDWFEELLPPPRDDGANTPGYWKNHPEQMDAELANIGLVKEALWVEVFGVDPECLEAGKRGVPDAEELTLLEALDLGGGGIRALVRHSTAALNNAATDEATYGFGGYDLPSEIADTLDLIDLNDDQVLQPSEVIMATGDVACDDSLYDTDLGIEAVKDGFDFLNNFLPEIEFDDVQMYLVA